MKKFTTKTKTLIIFAFVLFILVLPLIIHILYNIPSLCAFFLPQWKAGEMLTYYGTIVLGLFTVYTALIALELSKVANSTSIKMLEISKINYRAMVVLDEKNCEIQSNKGNRMLKLIFCNITDNLIIDFNINPCTERIFLNGWPYDEENDTGIIISKFDPILNTKLWEKDHKLVLFLPIEEYKCPNNIITFKTEYKSIYGINTDQYFSLFVEHNFISGYKTKVEEF